MNSENREFTVPTHIVARLVGKRAEIKATTKIRGFIFVCHLVVISTMLYTFLPHLWFQYSTSVVCDSC